MVRRKKKGLGCETSYVISNLSWCFELEQLHLCQLNCNLNASLLKVCVNMCICVCVCGLVFVSVYVHVC